MNSKNELKRFSNNQIMGIIDEEYEYKLKQVIANDFIDKTNNINELKVLLKELIIENEINEFIEDYIIGEYLDVNKDEVIKLITENDELLRDEWEC